MSHEQRLHVVASLHLRLLRPVQHTSGCCASTSSAQSGFSLCFCHLMGEHSSFYCRVRLPPPQLPQRSCHRLILVLSSPIRLSSRGLWIVYLGIACGQTVSNSVLSTIRFPSNWSVSLFRYLSVRVVGEGHMETKSLLQSF